MIGDELSEIFKIMLPYAKNILPKLATTIGLAGISAATSNSIKQK